MGLLDLFRRSKPDSKPSVRLMSTQEMLAKLESDDYIPLNKHPDVITAVDRVADMVSNMTIQLWENTEKGDVRVRDGLSRKLDIEPCRNMTRKSWLYKIVRDLMLDGKGNSVVHMSFDLETGLIKDLMPFPMAGVSYAISDDSYVIHYNGKTYTPDEVIHFVINPDPDYLFWGTGYRIQLRDIVQNLQQATRTKRGFMKERNMPSLIIAVDADVEELASEQGRERIIKKYMTNRNAGDPMVIPGNTLSVEQVKPLTLKDIAINESVEIDKKTLAGVLGVPAFFLGVGEFNKEEFNNWVNTKVMSMANTIAQTLTRDILVSESRYFKLNPRSLYAYSINDLVTAGGQMVQLNAMRRNELRDWVGLPPDEEMDELIILENYLPQDKLGDQKKLEGGD